MLGGVFLLAQILSLVGLVGAWATDIERLTKSKIIVMRLTPGELPVDEPHRSVARKHFSDPVFLQMFTASQALSLNPNGAAGPFQYIFVNAKLAPGDQESLDGLLGHELGHLWIRAQGYPTPRYATGEAGCLSVATGDALQHILMRGEMDMRGIEWRSGFIDQLELALAKMKEPLPTEPAKTPRCQMLAQVSLWLDVDLGLKEKDWIHREEFLQLLGKRFPAVAEQGRILSRELAAVNLADKDVHRRQLQLVFTQLKGFAVTHVN